MPDYPLNKLEIFQTHEADAGRLAEELGATKARQQNSESKTSEEIQKLAEQHEDLERKYTSEVGAGSCV